MFLVFFLPLIYLMYHRNSELEATLTEMEVYYRHREIKSDAIIQQQTKLIDYLQKRIEEGNKKKKVCKYSDTIFVQNLFSPSTLINKLATV
jgi:hypothetical protein